MSQEWRLAFFTTLSVIAVLGLLLDRGVLRWCDAAPLCPGRTVTARRHHAVDRSDGAHLALHRGRRRESLSGHRGCRPRRRRREPVAVLRMQYVIPAMVLILTGSSSARTGSCAGATRCGGCCSRSRTASSRSCAGSSTPTSPSASRTLSSTRPSPGGRGRPRACSRWSLANAVIAVGVIGLDRLSAPRVASLGVRRQRVESTDEHRSGHHRGASGRTGPRALSRTGRGRPVTAAVRAAARPARDRIGTRGGTAVSEREGRPRRKHRNLLE